MAKALERLDWRADASQSGEARNAFAIGEPLTYAVDSTVAGK